MESENLEGVLPRSFHAVEEITISGINNVSKLLGSMQQVPLGSTSVDRLD
jgi:hypothetical protein